MINTLNHAKPQMHCKDCQPNSKKFLWLHQSLKRSCPGKAWNSVVKHGPTKSQDLGFVTSFEEREEKDRKTVREGILTTFLQVEGERKNIFDSEEHLKQLTNILQLTISNTWEILSKSLLGGSCRAGSSRLPKSEGYDKGVLVLISALVNTVVKKARKAKFGSSHL